MILVVVIDMIEQQHSFANCQTRVTHLFNSQNKRIQTFDLSIERH